MQIIRKKLREIGDGDMDIRISILVLFLLLLAFIIERRHGFINLKGRDLNEKITDKRELKVFWDTIIALIIVIIIIILILYNIF